MKGTCGSRFSAATLAVLIMGAVIRNASAAPPPPRETTNSIGIKLVWIEPGTFVMGQDGPAADYNVKAHAAKFDDADWDEKPAHRVKITAPFSLAVTEVTLGQYRQFKA